MFPRSLRSASRSFTDLSRSSSGGRWLQGPGAFTRRHSRQVGSGGKWPYQPGRVRRHSPQSPFFVPWCRPSSTIAAQHVNLAAICRPQNQPIGAICAFSMWKTGDVVATRVPKLHSLALQRWCFRALYLSKLLWIAVSSIFGTLTQSWLMRLLSGAG
jgi:hypothetical protein